jgi:hypothetical protein
VNPTRPLIDTPRLVRVLVLAAADCGEYRQLSTLVVMAVTEYPGDAPLEITEGARGSPRHANTVNCRDYLRRSRICGLDRLLRLSIAPNDRTALKTRLADFVPADFLLSLDRN